MRNRTSKFVSVLLISLGIASAMVAQEISPNIHVQSSILNIRQTGFATLGNSLTRDVVGPVAEKSVALSPFAKIHPLAHQWGRIAAQASAATAKPSALPLMAALPIVGPDAGFSGFAALTGKNQASVSRFDLEPPDQGSARTERLSWRPLTWPQPSTMQPRTRC